MARRPALRRATLAIATVVDVEWKDRSGFMSVACGLTKWCLNARLLTQRLGTGVAEVMVLTNNATFVQQECAHVENIRVLPFSESLESTILQWRDSQGHSLSGAGLTYKNKALVANLRKWEYVGHTEYDAIYSADHDVDFFFNESALAKHVASWPIKLHRFKHSSMMLLATGCFESPFNGGSFLVRPSKAFYDAGIQVLETRRWNATHGFNLTGRPRELLLPRDVVRFRISRAVAKNTWDFGKWEKLEEAASM